MHFYMNTSKHKSLYLRLNFYQTQLTQNQFFRTKNQAYA